MKPIIVGIDPGTTAAYSVLDINGGHLAVHSSRTFDLGKMISEVIGHGNPLVVGCDKANPPGFVKKFATKVGAVLVSPDHDLLQDEKRGMVDIETDADHEFDAHASAVYAYMQHEKVLGKVDEVLSKEGKKDLSDRVKYLVVKEGLNIQKAIQALEKEEEEDEPKVKTKLKVVRPEKELEEKDKEIALLEQKNDRLKTKLRDYRKKIKRMERRIEKGMPRDEVIEKKESTIRSLSNRASRKEAEARHLEKKVDKLKALISGSAGRTFLKKLDNLSSRGFGDSDIEKGDVLLVEDPNVTSQEVIDEIRGEVNVIVHRKKLAVRHDGFVYVNADNLELEETDDFALVDEEELKSALSKGNVLKRVVMDYKNKRLNQG